MNLIATMADKEEGHTTAPKGADWEVVSLTASAYAAAPGGKIPEPKHEEKGEVVNKDKVESSNALFMSGHFVFPPKEETEILDHHDNSESVNDVDGKPDAKEKENDDLKKLTELDDFYSSPTLHSLHSEATMGALNLDDETRELDESILSSDEPKEDNHDASGVPYGVWLKERAVSLYVHTKETSTFWSIFAAAAVMGIVIIGQQWQNERWQILRHEWKFRIHDERMRMMSGPISRFKDAIVGGNRRDFPVNGSTSRDI
ncbi:hypothetical protein L1887_37003 [Cichorium endivia]|nr:hypothetical protein L1887_37003 [Cichorium endivia]